MKKRILSFALALVLTLALVPVSAMASDNFDLIIPDWVVEIDYLGRSVLLLGTPESGLRINADSYLEELGYDFKTPITLTIPNSVQEFDNGYENSTLRQKVVKVILSEGMTKIDRQAFCDWSNLKSVILPDSLIEIREDAFAKCRSLESIEFPKGLKNIERGAFRGTALSQVVLPNGLESIGDGAFYSLPPLTDLTIPPSVVLFGEVIVLDPLYVEYHLYDYDYDFDGNFTTIHGVAGSSAEKYAKENKLPFSAITMPGVTPAPAPAQVQEPISFEQAYKDMQSRMLSKYNIKVVSDWAKSVDDVAYHESSVEIYMSMIPKELHNAVVAYNKARGKTLTINFFVSSDDLFNGTYIHDSATIRLANSDELVFLHEYGHMLHRIVNEKYGSSKFSDEWTALNGGIPYDKDKNYYNDMDYEYLSSYFVSTDEYHMGNIGEDIAETFSNFSSEPGDGSHIIERYGGANTWKKSELLNKAVSKALNISGIYNPYEPQAPSSWAIESVDKAFSDGENGGLIGRKDETPNYFTSPIKRADVCSYVIGALNKAYEKDHGIPLIEGYGETLRLLDVATGEYEYVNRYSANPVPLFSDWSAYSDEYVQRVPIAAYYGIVTGVGNNRFDPRGSLTREQAAVILHRAAVFLGMPDTGTAPSTPADAASISSWAVDGVSWAMRNGIMSGTGGGNFSPKATYSVEQAIVTLVRLFDRP